MEPALLGHLGECVTELRLLEWLDDAPIPADDEPSLPEPSDIAYEVFKRLVPVATELEMSPYSLMRVLLFYYKDMRVLGVKFRLYEGKCGRCLSWPWVEWMHSDDPRGWRRCPFCGLEIVVQKKGRWFSHDLSLDEIDLRVAMLKRFYPFPRPVRAVMREQVEWMVYLFAGMVTFASCYFVPPFFFLLATLPSLATSVMFGSVCSVFFVFLPLVLRHVKCLTDREVKEHSELLNDSIDDTLGGSYDYLRAMRVRRDE